MPIAIAVPACHLSGWETVLPWAAVEGSSSYVLSLLGRDAGVRDLVRDLVPDDLGLEGCKIRAYTVVERKPKSIVFWTSGKSLDNDAEESWDGCVADPIHLGKQGIQLITAREVCL